MNTTSMQEKDLKHYLSPMSNWKELEQEGGRRIIVKGEDIYFWDEEGKRYLDGMSGLWCINLGYSCSEIKEAIQKQLSTLPYYNSFFKTSNLPTTALSELLAKVTPEGINHFFYGSSGSDANDTVFKLIRRYQHSRSKPDKKIVISRKNAYHGSTVLSAILGGMKAMHELNDLQIPDIVHIDQPYTYDAGVSLNDFEFGVTCAKELEKKILELGADRVAAFIGEPIQGAGGVIIPPQSYWPEIQKICQKYDVLLVSDEVICGFGRTGKWFGCEYDSVLPDIVALAKGITSGYLPLSAVGVSDKVYRGLLMSDKEFSHGYTYSGHPVATAAGVATLEVMIKEQIVETVEETLAPYFHHWGDKMKDHPLIGEVRYRGMLMAFEIVKDKETRARFKTDLATVCREVCTEQGLVMRACKQTMVLAPPLIITKKQIDEMFVLIQKIFDDTFERSKLLE